MGDEKDNVQIWVSRQTRKMLRQIQVEHDDRSLIDIYEMVTVDWIRLNKAMKEKGISVDEAIEKIKKG